MSPSEPTRGKMKCPRCGADMNHYADKVFPADPTKIRSDSPFPGIVLELHGCPRCGAAANREAPCCM